MNAAPALPANQPAITVEDLSKTYRDGWFGRRKFEALKRVSFDVGRGEVFGLLGPNGAGKTTFLKILLGIIGKSGGSASMLGQPAGSRTGRRRVGYLPEQLRIPRHLSGDTALDYYGRLNGLSSSEIKARRGGLLQFVGLAGRGGDSTSKYSKGMLQRLGLAQALLHEPELLVLDEPTDGLDPGARAEMRTLMQDLRRRGVTIFLNSHLLQEVEMVCDRVAILDRGQLRYCGPVRDIGNIINPAAAGSAFQVHLELGTDPSTVRQALLDGVAGEVGAPVVVDTATIDAGTRLTVCFPSQSAVDAAIDRLRAAGISVLGLQRETTTLEQAFLRLVAAPASTTPSS
jgi:ABC-2 type transport system ATP-binding protein